MPAVLVLIGKVATGNIGARRTGAGRTRVVPAVPVTVGEVLRAGGTTATVGKAVRTTASTGGGVTWITSRGF